MGQKASLFGIKIAKVITIAYSTRTSRAVELLITKINLVCTLTRHTELYKQHQLKLLTDTTNAI